MSLLLRVAPLPFFLVGLLAPFACGVTSAPGAEPRDASTDNPALPRHFEAAADEGTVEATDEYAPQAAHCTRHADAGVPTVFDAGADAAPAVAALPQVVGLGGATFSAPTLVSVTFPGDALADPLDDFTASVGCTGYWRTVGADYGVGDAVAGPPVRLTEAAPSSIDDADLRGWLTKKIDGGDPHFPRPAAGTIYVLWYPGGTTITLQGSASCRTFGGYHESTTLGDGTPVSYAVLPRCKGDDVSGLASLTLAASHELLEASTDPQPEVSPAFAFPDANHIGWGLFAGAEVGDMCEFQNDNAYVPPGFPWVVQRIWSNRAAWAGETPCVPADSPSYFYATALPTDSVTLDLTGTPQSYPAVHVPVGGTGTVAVQVLGSGATAAAQLEAIDPSTLYGLAPVLKLSLDSAVVAPGATVHLTIQKLASGPAGAESFLLQTTMNGRQTLSWGVTSD